MHMVRTCVAFSASGIGKINYGPKCRLSGVANEKPYTHRMHEYGTKDDDYRYYSAPGTYQAIW